MKKKLISLACIIGIFSTSSTLANNKVGIALDQGFGVAGQFNNVQAFIGNDGLSGDYLFKQGTYSSDVPFSWYAGGGAYYNWHANDNIGLRVPLGITFPFAPKWDLFGQISPVLDFDLEQHDATFGVDFALGIRYAF